MSERPRWLPTRRGVFLIVFSGIYTLFGYSLLLVDVTPAVDRAYSVILNVAPLEVYAAAWLLVALVALVAGFSRRVEVVAFGLAALMPLLWAIVYLVSWWHDNIPNGWVESAIFAGLAGAVMCVAGMSEPVAVRNLRDTAAEGNGDAQ